ncbi:unnamed protein product [Miscanthus lutarioriparius]|uniref:DJ-1/PfpI domain-containing protein n=1 Tax=Miscanthus lutarioriparius TaxID=422564 RepID=A0A811RQS8_9POAL|nr:unnamed protein product [Miscanthus lutarioriparius]
MAPWSTTGGLGDVLGGLPPALAVNGSHGMAWSTHAAEATPTSSPTSTLPGASTPSLAMLSSISLEHASLGARQVFEELSLHADIFCNICIGFELPSRMSLGVDQHQPWPPPDDLRLMSCDAELRPTPWPLFNKAERLSVRSSWGRLWKPPWPIQICQQIRFVLTDLAVSWKYMMIPVLGAMAMCASVDLRSIPWPSFSVFHEFTVQWCSVFDRGKCHQLGGILVRKFSGAQKPIASVCHGQLILAAARVIENRTCTTYPFVTPVWVAVVLSGKNLIQWQNLIVNAFGDSVAGSDKKMLFLCGEHTWVSTDEHELEVWIFQLQQPWPPPAVLPLWPLPWPSFSSYAASVHTSLSVVLCYHPPLSVSVGGTDCFDGAHLAAVVVLLVTARILFSEQIEVDHHCVSCWECWKHWLKLLQSAVQVAELNGGRVNDSNGSSVVTINTSQFKVNPDLPVAEELQQWDITEGQNTAFISLSPELSNMSRNYVLETIAQIKDEKVGQSDKPDFITVRAVLSHVRADIFCYLACSLELTGKHATLR